MSSQAIPSSPPAMPPPQAPPTKARGVAAARLLGAIAVLAPAFLALAALLTHECLPDRQELPLAYLSRVGDASHPYPLLLRGVLAASLLAAAVQIVWRSLRPWARHYGPLLAGLIFVLGLWDLATLKSGWLKMPFFPGPNMVLEGLIDDRVLLLESAWHSLRLLLSGYAVGVAAGLISGVLLGWFRLVRYWGMPILKLLGPIPATALVPLVMTMSSNAFLSATTLIAFAVWFPVTMLTASGVSNVRLSYLDVARTLGAGRLYLIGRVALPAALPNIFIGLFMGLMVSFLTLMVAETVGVKGGLGWYVGWRQGTMEYTRAYAALLLVAVFCSTLMTLLFKVRDHVLKWQKGVIRW